MEIVLLSWHLTPPSLFLFNFSFFLFLLLLHLFQSFISLSFLSSFFFCCNSRTYAASNTIALESLSNRYQTDNEAVYSLILNTYHSISRNHCFLLLPTPLLSLAWGLKLSHLPRPDHPQEVNKRGEHRLLIIPLLIHRHNHMIHLPILFFLHHWTLPLLLPPLFALFAISPSAKITSWAASPSSILPDTQISHSTDMQPLTCIADLAFVL